MSEIDAISSSQPSLLNEIINSPNTSDPSHEWVDSSTSIDELNDKLAIIETANKGQNVELVDSINRIQSMIQNGDSLDTIKSSFSN